MIEHRTKFHKQTSQNFSQTVIVLSTSTFQQTHRDSPEEDSFVEYTIASTVALQKIVKASEQDQWDAIKSMLIQMQSPKVDLM